MTYSKGSVRDFMAWSMTVANDPFRSGEKPKRWFDSDETAASSRQQTSAESLVKLLSNDNLRLLRVIGTHEFGSLSELASSTNRAEPNLSRTLKKLAEAGIVELIPNGRSLRPRLVARRVTLDLDLAGSDGMVSVVHPRT